MIGAWDIDVSRAQVCSFFILFFLYWFFKSRLCVQIVNQQLLPSLLPTPGSTNMGSRHWCVLSPRYHLFFFSSTNYLWLEYWQPIFQQQHRQKQQPLPAIHQHPERWMVWFIFFTLFTTNYLYIGKQQQSGHYHHYQHRECWTGGSRHMCLEPQVFALSIIKIYCTSSRKIHHF